MNKLSLKTKAILFACAIGIIPMLTLGVSSYIATSGQTQQQQTTAQQDRATSLNDKVKRFLFERYGDVQVLAKLPMLSNPKDRNILSLLEKQTVLDEYAKTYGVYDSIAVFDLAGDVMVQSSGNPASNHKSRDYFQEVLKTDKPVISVPETSKTTGELVVHFAAPVKDTATDKTVAILRTRMPVKHLYNLLFAEGEQGDEWHLVDAASGKVFAAFEKQQVGQQIQTDFSKLSFTSNASKTQTFIDKGVDGAEQLVTYMPIGEFQGLPRLKWDVALATNTKDAFAVQRMLLLTLILGIGVTGVIVGGLAFLFANRTSTVIKDVASTITVSSSEIAATVEQQERTVREQAEAVNQTTVTMDELGTTSRRSAEQAAASAAGAQQVLALANNGTQVVQQTMAGMTTLKEKVEAIADQITSLSQQTSEIGNISSLVRDLAQKTNNLALNAAVEAARAGEHGQGFSIVAREVRKLADQSKRSATEINALVSEIQAAINRTVTVTDEGTKTVEQGIELAQGTAEAFAGVAAAVDGVVQNSEQISMSAKHQAVAVQQVVANMNALNLSAQESAAGINQVRVTTQELSLAAQELAILM
jgi:Methyl-accepting chemotaxis protein (MCP) signalling domain/Cache domain